MGPMVSVQVSGCAMTIYSYIASKPDALVHGMAAVSFVAYSCIEQLATQAHKTIIWLCRIISYAWCTVLTTKICDQISENLPSSYTQVK